MGTLLLLHIAAGGLALVVGAVALVGGVSDLRMVRAGGLRGAPRIARHLWRMSFALWIATASFFLGQAQVIPEPLRIFPILTVLAYLPLAEPRYTIPGARGGRGIRRRPARAGAPDERRLRRGHDRRASRKPRRREREDGLS